MARVKYLGKSKHSFAVNVKGVEYKFKPDKMTHLEMPEEHAAVLVSSAPNVWVVEGAVVVGAAPIEADLPEVLKVAKKKYTRLEPFNAEGDNPDESG